MLIGIDASRAVVRPRTGTEAYSYHLISELLELDSRHRFRLYFNSPPAPGELTFPRAEPVVIPSPRLWTHLRLSAELVRRPPDLLFVPSHVLPVARPRRAVATVHDLGYLRWPRAHPRSRWWYLHLSTQFNARASRLVIADSAATRDDLVRAYGISGDKIRVVHLGCSPRFRPSSPGEVGDTRARYALNGPYILAVGTLQPRKNLARLFDAFALARPGLPSGCQLVVAGAAGYSATDIGRRAESLGDSVRFLGYVPEADLPGLFGAALALAFPSLYEGFGLPAVEAMACGTPVIASNTSSLPEVVGDAGCLVDPTSADAIAGALVEVAGDSALRAELRSRGLARARAFTWRRCAAGVLRVLEEAAEPD